MSEVSPGEILKKVKTVLQAAFARGTLIQLVGAIMESNLDTHNDQIEDVKLIIEF